MGPPRMFHRALLITLEFGNLTQREIYVYKVVFSFKNIIFGMKSNVRN